MTLDEMLALLPDNTTGEINPADLRAIVTDLFEAAHFDRSSSPYGWSTVGTAPATGRVTTDQPWLPASTKVLIAETADDGTTMTFAVLDRATEARIWVTNATGSQFEADVTGPSVDLGTYREIPIAAATVVGPQPINNGDVTVTIATVQP